MTPCVISFSTVISAYDRERQWKQASTLLHKKKVCESNWNANMISFKSADERGVLHTEITHVDNVVNFSAAFSF